MSVIARENEVATKVFDDLFLSRRISKRAEGTQTPPRKEYSVPGEIPDENVSSLIEILSPSLRRIDSSRTTSIDSRESSPLTLEEISVDRRQKILIEEHSTMEVKEVFEELCLSRRKRSYTRSCEAQPPAEPLPKEGVVPDEEVSSAIEMLRPSIRQLYTHSTLLDKVDKLEIKKNTDINDANIRGYQSEPVVAAPLLQPLTTTLSDVSLDSIFTSTTPSNFTDTIDEGMIKSMLSSHQNTEGRKEEVPLVDAGSNTDSSSVKKSRRRSKKKKKKHFKATKDSGTDTIRHTEDSINQTESSTNRTDESNQTGNQGTMEPKNDIEDEINTTEKIIGIIEHCEVNIIAETKKSKEVQVDNSIIVLRNGTEWTETPFLPPELSDTIEESTSNVDSEPTRGCPSTLQHQIQFNRAEKSNSKTKTGSRRIKAILHTGKKMEGQYNQEQGMEYGIDGRMFPSSSSLGTPGSSTVSSLTSRTYSCSSCGDDKSGSCGSNTISETLLPPGEPKVFWAITKINVYPDDSRTYEVMPLTGKKPAELPEKSDSVFVLIPPKQG